MIRLPMLAVIKVFLLSSVTGWAGIQQPAALTEQPIPRTTEPWEITVGGPGWLAGISGHTGFRGVNPHVDVGIIQILRHIDVLYATEAEVRKGRFGVLGDVLYLNGQAGTSGSGLVSRVGAGLQEFLGEAFLSYRVIDNPRGSLDLLAGFRFIYLGMQTTLSPDVPAIDAASTELVNRFATTLGSDLQASIQQNILNRLNSLRASIPSLPVAPVAAPEIDRIRDSLQQLLKSREQELAAAIRAGAGAEVNTLKAQLNNQVATFVTSRLNRTYSFYDNWFDPLIGLRGRLNLSKVFYLTAETDVGGFGIGSDIAWQGYAALGCQITRNIFSEVGYRYIYDDFRDESSGFLYQASTHGAQITIGVRF